MKWFRLWVDILDDVKTLQLTDYEFRMFTYLMALASEVDSKSGECQFNVKSMSIRFRTQVNHLSRAIETFQRAGLVAINSLGFVVISNWSKRQFKSDRVTDRVNKFRQVNKERNVSETELKRPQITDTETDTDKTYIGVKKVRSKKPPFAPPTIEEVTQFCLERGKGINPQQWIDHYTSNGWMVGKNRMKDWKAAVRTWEARRGENGNGRINGAGRPGLQSDLPTPKEWTGDDLPTISEAERQRNADRAQQIINQISKG